MYQVNFKFINLILSLSSLFWVVQCSMFGQNQNDLKQAHLYIQSNTKLKDRDF